MRGETSAQAGTEGVTVCCLAQDKLVLDLIDILAWLCASLRTSSYKEPSVSYTFLSQYSCMSHAKFYVSLANLTSNRSYFGNCWHTLIPKSVIADGFPVLARNGEKGIEVSLEILMTISRVFTTAVVGGKYYLIGLSTALVPTQKIGKLSLQWHIIKTHPSRILLTDLSLPSVLSTTEFGTVNMDSDSLFSRLNERRHFLGWCEHSQITIGTGIGVYTTQFTEEPEASRSLQMQTIGANIGTPGMGIFNAVLTANFTLSPVRIEQDQLGSLRYESILRSARDLPYIIFDIESKRGWLVPAICVIYIWFISVLEEKMIRSGYPLLQLIGMEVMPHSKPWSSTGMTGWESVMRILTLSKTLYERSGYALFNARKGQLRSGRS